MAEIVEFYIACNPPLLPQGVSEVIRRVQVTEGLLEVLYEPHIPWFKCIAFACQKPHVTAAIQDNLFAIAEEDVDALDFEEPTEGDVTILSPDPRMMSWHDFVTNGADAYTYADADLFPELVLEFRYKTMWRALERFRHATLEILLLKCREYGDDSIPHTVEQLAAVTGCQMSYNARKTMLYIGADDSSDTVQAAIEKLDAMARVFESDFDGELPTFPQAQQIVPSATEPRPISNDPFDAIPDDINANLQETIVPWSTRYNEGSLI